MSNWITFLYQSSPHRNDRSSNQTLFYWHSRGEEILEEAACQSCMAENEAETARHFLRYYPAFAMLRLKHLHCHTYYEPSDLTGINISRLKKCVTSSRCFVDMRRHFWSILRSFGHRNEYSSLAIQVGYSWPHKYQPVYIT